MRLPEARPRRRGAEVLPAVPAVLCKLLTGQCSEAVILGVLMALAFSVFKIPYGSLVGVLAAICAIIPYVGALISCVVSVFLVLLVDPVLARALPDRVPCRAVC
ncbi:MAG: AI-2E family transporter [Faecalibacterium prausnitzii]